MATHRKEAKPYQDSDPPCLVSCPHCMETVVAKLGTYWNFSEDKGWFAHDHQPCLGNERVAYLTSPLEPTP